MRYGTQAAEARDEARLLRLLRFAALIKGAGDVCAMLVAAVLAPWIGPKLG